MSKEIVLAWSGGDTDINMRTDGEGQWATTFTLTETGIKTVLRDLGLLRYRYSDFCECVNKKEGDGIHVAGEPSDLICLKSPIKDY